MAARAALNNILRDAAKTPLLRMRSELASHSLRIDVNMLCNVSAAAIDISGNKSASFEK
jgi:hypothetical protein